MMSFVGACEVVRKYTSKDVAPFYRTIYNLEDSDERLVVSTAQEWGRLPFITKEIMLSQPLPRRWFASGADTDHLRSTSGTSGNLPVFCPRTHLREMEYRAQYHDFARPILAFGVPAMPHWHEAFQRSLGQKPRVIEFDPKYPDASVRLACLAGVSSISVFAFHMRMIGESMQAQKYTRHIKFIEICGESCTQALFTYLRNTFPNATILPFYGASEVEDSPIGVPVRPITGEEPLALYCAKNSQYHEIINPETGAIHAPAVGAEGELVITAYPGEPSAFPLIRYRSGDMVRVVECDEHGWTFTVLGRVESDFLKIAGGVLRTDEMERVLRSLQGVTDRFEIHRFERATADGPKPQVIVHVETIGAGDLASLASHISRHFRVSPVRTYEQGVAEGMYLPLLCVPLQAPPTSLAKKHKRMKAEME